MLVGLAAWMNPGAFGILDAGGQILTVSRIELGLGIAIGAITFSGSVIAFLKLSGRMGGKPIMLPGRHVINLGTLAAIIALIAAYAMSSVAGPGEGWMIIAVAALLLGSSGVSAREFGEITGPYTQKYGDWKKTRKALRKMQKKDQPMSGDDWFVLAAMCAIEPPKVPRFRTATWAT